MNHATGMHDTRGPAGLLRGGDPSPTAATKRRVGRFRERRGLGALRFVCGFLSKAAPALAAHLGYALLARPPRAPERHWEEKLRLAARTSKCSFGAGQLAVYEWGSGPAVLMVHGWGARATHMGKMIMPLVNAGYRVVSFDAPAHGHSTGRTTDLVQYAAAIHRVTLHAGKPVAIVAHSFGAAMALYALRDWPVNTGRVVLISSLAHCAWFTGAFGKYLGLAPNVVTRMQRMMADRYEGQFDWNSMSVAGMLNGTPLPALLIHDQHDEEIPCLHSAEIASKAPHAELHLTSGLGHHRLLGDATVIDRVVRFIDRGGAS